MDDQKLKLTSGDIYRRLFKASALSPKAMRRLPQETIARLIYPTGYYNAKARKLKAFAAWSGRHYGDRPDRLFAQDINTLRERLPAVYGIGEETADSILLYAGNKPEFMIDAYTRRIIDRPGLAPLTKDYKSYRNLFMECLQADVPLFNEYHALPVRLGKETCRKKPLCHKCCLKSICPEAKTPRL